MTQPALAARNAPILAAMAQFAEQASAIVSVLIRRAQGGDPVCLKLCLKRALPVGRLAPKIDIAPGYDPGNLKGMFTAIGALLERHCINIRQASRLLDCLGAPPDRRSAPSGAGSMRLRPAIVQIRKYANIEAGLAKTLSALGLDDILTVAPGGFGGVFETHQTNQAPPTPNPSPPFAAQMGGGEPREKEQTP